MIITSRSFCLCSRCVVFNNRGVSGEMLLVRLCPASVPRPCSDTQLVQDGPFPLFPAELSVSLLQPAASVRVSHVSQSTQGHSTDRVVAQRGLSCSRYCILMLTHRNMSCAVLTPGLICPYAPGSVQLKDGPEL